MDIVLDYADHYVLDTVYAHIARAFAATPWHDLVDAHLLVRDSLIRQGWTLFWLNAIGAIILYLLLATVSFYTIYDHDQMKHPKFLPNQIQREIKLSVIALPLMSALMLPLFLWEVRGYSKLYDNVDEYGWGYLVATVPLYLFFTDMCIYWIHRWEHHPAVYAYVHKPHHLWKVPTPFAAYAFHPVDGFLQALPYHMFPFIFPLHKYLYLGLFLFVMIWTVFIHDGAYFVSGTFINGAAHHTVHHLEFNYNYGQYFTLWDILGGSHKTPTLENTMPQKGKLTQNMASTSDVQKSGKKKRD
ncbi:Lathosterol oxidase [Allomyces javanicus]|nr:Lathosterol oxidase [Allomyces javanicus]